ncbi:MAG: methyltransferase domain-containing protein [Thiohalophilus sp.]|uniref:methyltransferase domain-containing protein n=1 Tax=Thiohalophilus sp. TaxID=3028392 RepID=UPI002870635C|nr:methyltransferase domain-containing protein [Thiohalophilus sp.]MDR9436724.1 methyltransferase domain-containing protein [Thiohalophilus sp.]
MNELDELAHERLIERLESRAQVNTFSDLFEKYVNRIEIPEAGKILEVGCGTGVILRQLAQRHGFDARGVGIDHCKSFIDAATKYADQESVADSLEFRLGDAHNLDFEDGEFDVVICHTVISHVTEPAKILSEVARVTKKGGVIAIFDGDYSSLTYAFPDHSFGRKMDAALSNTTFNNPRIMCDLPRLLPQFDLELTDAWGDAVVEIGQGSYFKTFAETYAPYVKNSGQLSDQTVDIWLKEQNKAMENGTFFAACNYYTYLSKKV